MTISANLEKFNGKKIKDFNPEIGIEEPGAYAYRVRIDWDSYDKGGKLVDLLETFYKDSKSATVTELVIGAFDFESSADTSEIVASLVGAQSTLSNLKALFIGDITYEESEISWIQQSNVGPVLEAYPALEYFRVRGGNGLSLGNLTHQSLKYLIVETGGLPRNVIEEVSKAQLPALEHLELWLGSAYYGFDATVDDFAPILSGTLFPNLQYLGLRDSEIADELAKALKTAPILKKLKVLDLSLGTLGDEGAQALLECPSLGHLKLLDVHHHYISDKMIERIQELGVEVDASEQQEKDDGDRYIAVSE